GRNGMSTCSNASTWSSTARPSSPRLPNATRSVAPHSSRAIVTRKRRGLASVSVPPHVRRAERLSPPSSPSVNAGYPRWTGAVDGRPSARVAHAIPSVASATGDRLTPPGGDRAIASVEDLVDLDAIEEVLPRLLAARERVDEVPHLLAEAVGTCL